MALKVKTYDALSGEALSNVTLTLTPTNGLFKAGSASGNGKMVKKTANGGGSFFKGLEDGSYTITTEKPGYKKANETANVVKGEREVLEIKLERA